jgi:phosphoglycolate phosphatase-like HAD superfamily hydrolase
MDGTLTVPNLDFVKLYKDCGLEGKKDILAEIAKMPLKRRTEMLQIVEDFEADGRRKLELMPGAVEVLAWLHAHKIPVALVTRNTHTTVDVLVKKIQNQLHLPLAPNGPSVSVFSHVVARDDPRNIPPKPDPAALHVIAKEVLGMDVPSSEILMVGDSIDNDIIFGKTAGAQTALLVHNINYKVDQDNTPKNDDVADIYMEHLTELPRAVWLSYDIQGYLGTDNYKTGAQLHGLPAPTPSSELCKAIVEGNIHQLEALLNDLTLQDIVRPEGDSRNTALIWAAESGNDAIISVLLEALERKGNAPQEVDIISAFIQHRGYLGATAVTRAARRGHTSTLEILLQKISAISSSMALSNILDTPNDKLQYPLHFSAFKQHPETLKVLLKYGANPWVMDRKGRIPYQDTTCDVCKSILRKAMRESQ